MRFFLDNGKENANFKVYGLGFRVRTIGLCCCFMAGSGFDIWEFQSFEGFFGCSCEISAGSFALFTAPGIATMQSTAVNPKPLTPKP